MEAEGAGDLERFGLASALTEFRKGKPPFGSADQATIHEVVAAIGGPDLFTVLDAYVCDVFNRVHIHPTMIVADQPVPGAVRTDTYAQWPWKVELTGWTGRAPGRHEVASTGAEYCQSCFNPLDERHQDGCY